MIAGWQVQHGVVVRAGQGIEHARHDDHTDDAADHDPPGGDSRDQ